MNWKVTLEQANAPKPVPPQFYEPLYRWEYYWMDLACWIATQADRRRYGIATEETDLAYKSDGSDTT
jgi:hypothetical protein